MAGSIHVRGAREHNLKNVDVVIPRDQLTVITGLSGSGKSSLAFDTIYAEGQRRYVEVAVGLCAPVPGTDGQAGCRLRSTGLSPAISIEQKTTSRNPRSTVGTVTEIHDYMRLLWARVGVPYSPATGLPIEAQTVSQMVDRVLAMPEGTRLLLLAPGGARPQGRIPQGTGRVAAPRLHPREGGRQAVRDRRGPGAEPQDQARDRGGGGPHRGARRHRAAAGRQFRDRARAVRWRGLRRERRTGGERTVFSSRFACPVSRLHDRGDRAAAVQLQFARTAPARPATGWASRASSIRDWWCRTNGCSLAGRRDRAVDRRAEPVLRPDAAKPGAALQGHHARRRGSDLPAARARRDPERHRRGTGRVHLQGRRARLHGDQTVRGRAAQPATPLAGNRQRLGARGTVPLPGGKALRRLQRRAAEAGGAGGAGRRQEHRRGVGTVDPRRAARGSHSVLPTR